MEQLVVLYYPADILGRQILLVKFAAYDLSKSFLLSIVVPFHWLIRTADNS